MTKCIYCGVRSPPAPYFVSVWTLAPASMLTSLTMTPPPTALPVLPRGLPGRCDCRVAECRVFDRDARGAPLQQGEAAREWRPDGGRDCRQPPGRSRTSPLSSASYRCFRCGRTLLWLTRMMCRAGVPLSSRPLEPGWKERIIRRISRGARGGRSRSKGSHRSASAKEGEAIRCLCSPRPRSVAARDVIGGSKGAHGIVLARSSPTLGGESYDSSRQAREGEACECRNQTGSGVVSREELVAQRLSDRGLGSARCRAHCCRRHRPPAALTRFSPLKR
jgi:hypothetical protein